MRRAFPNSTYLARMATILVVLCLLLIQSASAQICINEFQAANASTILDWESMEYPDWIELYNKGNAPVNLNGYYLSDDALELQKWPLESYSLASHAYFLVWADKQELPRHANFKLDGDGECLYLISPEGSIVDSVCYDEQFPDVSQGRYPDGGSWSFYDKPSPGSMNSDQYITLSERPLEAITYQPAPGFYPATVEISLHHPDTLAHIYYTLNGSEPDTSDLLYSGPILIDQTRVIRAKAFRKDKLCGIDHSATYFINEDFGLPVLSFSFDSSYFWDPDIGIYLEENKSVDHNWERPVNMEIFDSRNPYITMGAGVQLYGAISRFVPMPSLAVHARQEYGTKSVKSKLFDDKNITRFKSFVLRNSGSDWEETLFNDALQQSLLRGRMDIDYQEYQPTIVFFNGQYWGIHNLREKLNEDYLEANHGVNPDSVNIVYRDKIVIEGSSAGYEALYDFVRFNNLNDSLNYEIVKAWMDIDEYMNYYIAEIYFFNQDWPNNNCKFWNEQKEGSPWRWMLYDLDFGFGAAQYTDNMVEWATDPGIYENYIFIRLLGNETFRNEFLQRFRAHLNTSFEPERVTAMIDSFQERLRPYMERHIERWNQPRSIAYWEDRVEHMRYFANHRQPVLKDHLHSKFNTGSDISLSVHNADPGMGKVYICGVELPDTFQGDFYSTIPLRMEAIAEKGYVFTGWTGYLNDTSRVLQFSLAGNALFEAHFTAMEPIENLYINEILTKNTQTYPDENQEFEDWIELYNRGSEDLDLAGLMITDDRKDLNKCILPEGFPDRTLLPAGERLVLFADNEAEEGPLHLAFKLGTEGESIYISQRMGTDTLILDSMCYGKQYANVSYGRMADGESRLVYMQTTPGLPNQQFPVVKGLVINEFSANNTTILKDTEGNFSDWIELHNHRKHAVNVGGMFLTDSLANPFKYRISTEYPEITTIPADGYLIIWADNEPEKGPLHTNFKLSRGGEQLGLSLPDGSVYLDSLSFTGQYQNASLSRFPDRVGNWTSIPATPGVMNTYTPVTGLIINEFSADNRSLLEDEHHGYSDWIEIFNSNPFGVDLGGLYLTDSLNFPTQHRIPTTEPDSLYIPGGEYMILFADNEPDRGVRHLNFKLSRGGEQLGLFGHTGYILDTLSFVEQYRNASSSRFPNAGPTWLSIPCSPGSSNEYIPVENIFINEFSASNTIYTDASGEWDDWIELYNANDFKVNLAGYYLSDSLGNPSKYRIPSTAMDSTILDAKAYLVLWADKDPEQGVRHLDFKLSAKGESLVLTRPDLSVLDELSFGESEANIGMSRYPDGEARWLALPITPEQPNLLPDYSNLVINELSPLNRFEAEDEYGETDDWIEIYNNNPYSVNLAGLYFSDDRNDLKKSRIPSDDPATTLIAPYSFALYWADGTEEQGASHLKFKLSTDGEWVGLFSEFAEEPEVLDSVTFGLIGNYQSFGRKLENPYQWLQFQYATPGRPNVVDINKLPGQVGELTFHFSPNPFRDELRCTFSTSPKENFSFILYNSQGSIIYSKEYHLYGSTEISWNTSALPPGVYIAVLHAGSKWETVKLIKE